MLTGSKRKTLTIPFVDGLKQMIKNSKDFYIYSL